MRKQLRWIAAVCAVVVLLGVGLGVLLWTTPEEPDDTSSDTSDDTSSDASSDTSITLLTKKHKDTQTVDPLIKEATVTVGKITYVLQQNKDKELYVKGYEKLPINASAATAFAQAVSNITAIQEIISTGNDADYGLDTPSAVVDVTYFDDTKATLHLGDKAPQNAGYYFRLSEKDAIYLVDSDLADTLTAAATDYISTAMTTAPLVKEDDENGQAVLRDVKLEGSGIGMGYSYRLITSQDTADWAYGTYLITAPYFRGGNSNVLDASISQMTSVSALSVVMPFPTASDLKQYGLDTPSITATVHTAVKTAKVVQTAEESDDGKEKSETEYYNVEEHIFRIGNKVDGNYYVLVDDVDCVYLVSDTSLAFATLTYEESVSEMLFLKDITSLSSLSITHNGVKTVFSLTHKPEVEDSDKNLIVKTNGEVVDLDHFRSFYQVMMSIERTGAAPAQPSGDAVFIISYYDMNTKETTNIEFFKHSASVYICRVDGDETFKIRASQVDYLAAQYQNLLDGKEVILKN